MNFQSAFFCGLLLLGLTVALEASPAPTDLDVGGIEDVGTQRCCVRICPFRPPCRWICRPGCQPPLASADEISSDSAAPASAPEVDSAQDIEVGKDVAFNNQGQICFNVCRNGVCFRVCRPIG